AALVTALVPILAAAGGILLLGACASCQSTVREAAVPAVAAGSFDGVEADQTAHRLYLADRTNDKVQTIDISSPQPRFAGSIDVGAAPNGLAVAPELLRLDPASGKVMNTIKVVGCRPNGLAINPDRQLAMTTCRSSVATVNLRTGAWDANRVVAGGDIVSYDAAANRFVVASPHDTTD